MQCSSIPEIFARLHHLTTDKNLKILIEVFISLILFFKKLKILFIISLDVEYL